VCLFSSDESPARISQSPRYPESSDDCSSPDSEIDEVGYYDADSDEEYSKKHATKIYEPWTIQSRTPRIPSCYPPIVSLDSIRLSNTTLTTIISPTSPTASPTSPTSPPPQRLTLTVLVRNLAYAKRVFVRYTTNAWRTQHDVVAQFGSVVMPGVEGYPGLDRFTVTLGMEEAEFQAPEADVEVKVLQGGTERCGVVIEMAVCVEMNGCAYWDNNSGVNHGCSVGWGVRKVGLMSAATAAMMVASRGALRTVGEVIEAAEREAVRSAGRLAGEVEGIRSEFERRRGGLRFLGGSEGGFRAGSVGSLKEEVVVGGVSEDEATTVAGGSREETPKMARCAKFSLSRSVPVPGAVGGGFGMVGRRKSGEEGVHDQDYIVATGVPASKTGFEASWAAASDDSGMAATAEFGVGSCLAGPPLFAGGCTSMFQIPQTPGAGTNAYDSRPLQRQYHSNETLYASADVYVRPVMPVSGVLSTSPSSSASSLFSGGGAFEAGDYVAPTPSVGLKPIVTTPPEPGPARPLGWITSGMVESPVYATTGGIKKPVARKSTSPTSMYAHRSGTRGMIREDIDEILGGRKVCASMDELIERKVMKSLDGWNVWESDE
ncbi:Protein phosphatase 1 regulatory subunit 3D, partial [Podochytrium sp. JEL0797]